MHLIQTAFLAMLFFPIVLSAPTMTIIEGQVFSQTQLNNADLKSINYGFRYQGIEFDLIGLQVQFKFNHYSLRNNEDGTYTVIRSPLLIQYSFDDALRCISSMGQRCASTVEENVKSQIKAYRIGLIEDLNKFKTNNPPAWNSKTFNFPEQELNN